MKTPDIPYLLIPDLHLKPKPAFVYTPAEFKLTRLRECQVDSPLMDTPERAVAFWRQHVVGAPWFQEDKECFCVFLLNVRRRILGYHMVSIGILDTILVHSRDVYRAAIVGNSSAILSAHNHPSGDPSPSTADIKVTRDLMRAGQLLKIELLDHLIIGSPQLSKGYCSLRELGYLYA